MSDTIALIAFGLILTLVVAVAVVAATTKSKCLAAGYAEYEIDFAFNRYCVQRDYRGVMKAIPLKEAIP